MHQSVKSDEMFLNYTFNILKIPLKSNIMFRFPDITTQVCDSRYSKPHDALREYRYDFQLDSCDSTLLFKPHFSLALLLVQLRTGQLVPECHNIF